MVALEERTGGSLTVTNIGAWPLEAGDKFTLFTASTYTNAFTSFTLPPLGAALAWDTSNLVFNGSITVINSTSAPVILHQPQGLTLNVGSPANFSVVAAGSRPLGYQWRKNGGNIAGATTSSYQLPATSTNDSGAYTVVVTNSFGSTTSVVATLNILPPGQSASVTNSLVVYLNLDNNLAAQAGTTNSGALFPDSTHFDGLGQLNVLSSPPVAATNVTCVSRAARCRASRWGPGADCASSSISARPVRSAPRRSNARSHATGARRRRRSVSSSRRA